MKLKKTLITIFVILLCILAACGGEQASGPEATPSPTPSPTIPVETSPSDEPDPAAEVTTQEYHEDFTAEDGYTLMNASVTLPAVATPASPAGEHITAYFNEIMEKEKAECKELAETASRAYAETGDVGGTYNLGQNYRVILNNGEYFSIVRERYLFTGGAHGGTLVYGETFELQTGDMLFLDSIFSVPAEEYTERLFDALIRIADKRGMEEELGEGYEERIRLYFDPGNFALTEEGVAIWYQEYDIGPYAAGTPTFIVPYPEILDILAINIPDGEAA